jgi:hypothetical protein
MLVAWSVSNRIYTGFRCWLRCRLQVISFHYVTDRQTTGLTCTFIILHFPSLIPTTVTNVESKKNKVFINIMVTALKSGMDPAAGSSRSFSRRTTENGQCPTVVSHYSRREPVHSYKYLQFRGCVTLSWKYRYCVILMCQLCEVYWSHESLVPTVAKLRVGRQGNRGSTHDSVKVFLIQSNSKPAAGDRQRRSFLGV